MSLTLLIGNWGMIYPMITSTKNPRPANQFIQKLPQQLTNWQLGADHERSVRYDDYL